jgi:DNA-binding NarL/FixJ family response regulator
MRPTVLIVDDHEDFRSSARALLELQGFEVVAAVEDGEAALDAVDRLRPDIVLLDVQLPGMDGFEVAERLASSARPPRVVLVSSRRRSAYEVRLPSAPVAGFLGKHELSGATLAALL